MLVKYVCGWRDLHLDCYRPVVLQFHLGECLYVTLTGCPFIILYHFCFGIVRISYLKKLWNECGQLVSSGHFEYIIRRSMDPGKQLIVVPKWSRLLTLTVKSAINPRTTLCDSFSKDLSLSAFTGVKCAGEIRHSRLCACLGRKQRGYKMTKLLLHREALPSSQNFDHRTTGTEIFPRWSATWHWSLRWIRRW